MPGFFFFCSAVVSGCLGVGSVYNLRLCDINHALREELMKLYWHRKCILWIFEGTVVSVILFDLNF